MASPTPAAHQPAESAGRVAVLTLPVEVLEQIFELSSVECTGEDGVYYRRARDLAPVCKGFYGTAQRLLYRAVVVELPADAQLLQRTLQASPALGRLVRVLGVRLCRLELGLGWNLWRLAAAVQDVVDLVPDLTSLWFRSEMTRAHGSLIASVAVAHYAVRKTRRLEHLEFQERSPKYLPRRRPAAIRDGPPQTPTLAKTKSFWRENSRWMNVDGFKVSWSLAGACTCRVGAL